MQNPYEQLLGVIPDHPQLRILHFAPADTPLAAALAALTQARQYEYLLLSFDADAAQSLAERYAPYPHIRVRHVTHQQARFHTQARQYDYVFVESDIPDPYRFLPRVHTAMKNAATLFVLRAHDDPQETERWRMGMEEHYFVAFNAFGLGESLHLISAKKMHGWGG